MEPLDRPVWASLDSRHSALCLGDALARLTEPWPVLHAWKTNLPAISLYRSLGFWVSAEVNLAVLKRPPN